MILWICRAVRFWEKRLDGHQVGYGALHSIPMGRLCLGKPGQDCDSVDMVP
jgi:hypothetical protein